MTSHLTPVDELPADADDQADDEPELTVPFCGEEWRISNRKIGLMHMMRYARATKRGMELAQSGVEPDGMIEMEILTATLDLLEQCVHSEEWSRFVLVTADAGADQDDYMNFAGEVMALRARRPTGRSTASSDGPPTTSSTSAAGSSSPDMSPEARRQIDRLNGMGRPEFAQMVRQAEESRERLTVADLCDVVYAVLVDRVEAEVRALQSAAAFGLMFGATVEFPELHVHLARFDEMLAEPPAVTELDPDQADLHRVFGLRGVA